MQPPAPPPIADDALLTTREVASLLRVHEKHVYRLFRRGLPRHRFGGEWRYRRTEVLRWAAGDAPTPVAVPPPPLVASAGDVATDLLLAAVRTEGGPCLGAVPADSATALSLLRARRALAVGFHGAPAPAEVPEGRVVRLHLVRREVGLVGPRGRTPRVQDALGGRLASRPPSAGVRATLDRALRGAGADPDTVHGAATVHASHADVVCAVARGDADVGVATHAWARRLGLAFAPLEVEDYGLLLLASELGRPEVVRLCEVAQRASLRTRLEGEAGYDARDVGAVRFAPDA